MANVKNCSDLEIDISRVSENGTSGEHSLFFATNKDFEQFDDDGKVQVKDSFSMSLQGLLQRVEFDNETAQDYFDYLGIATLNTPHKFVGVGQVIAAILGKNIKAKVSRELKNAGDVFEGYTIPSKRYVTTKLHITSCKPSKFVERFIAQLKERSAEEITI